MENVKIEMWSRVQNIHECVITRNKIATESRKKKTWTALGTEGVQNY